MWSSSIPFHTRIGGPGERYQVDFPRDLMVFKGFGGPENVWNGFM